jgi:hypothetical protein
LAASNAYHTQTAQISAQQQQQNSHSDEHHATKEALMRKQRALSGYPHQTSQISQQTPQVFCLKKYVLHRFY